MPPLQKVGLIWSITPSVTLTSKLPTLMETMPSPISDDDGYQASADETPAIRSGGFIRSSASDKKSFTDQSEVDGDDCPRNLADLFQEMALEDSRVNENARKQNSYVDEEETLTDIDDIGGDSPKKLGEAVLEISHKKVSSDMHVEGHGSLKIEILLCFVESCTELL